MKRLQSQVQRRRLVNMMSSQGVVDEATAADNAANVAAVTTFRTSEEMGFFTTRRRPKTNEIYHRPQRGHRIRN